MNEKLGDKKPNDSSLMTHNSLPSDSSLIKVLLIEDSPGDMRLMQETLAEAGAIEFELTYVERLSEALKHLSEDSFDVILSDLSLPDSQGLDTFIRVHMQAPDVPIVVLTSLDDEALAAKAVREGAQDYLVKGQVDSNLLVRSMRYAVERHRLQIELRAMSLVDELTGLYNRRGFLTLAGQQLKMANWTKREMVLLFIDLDGLKQINDTLGHHEGDMALIEAANILKESFRNSDIIARIGGDEFVALEIEASRADAEVLTARLQKNLETHNAKENRRYKLSVSMGIAHYNPECPCSIDELMAQADKLMYKHKQNKCKSWAVKSHE